MSSNKPEKFPRPKIKLDSTAKDWEQFTVTWTQYKQEYNLAGAGLIRQLIACCSEEMRHLGVPSLGGRKEERKFGSEGNPAVDQLPAETANPERQP